MSNVCPFCGGEVTARRCWWDEPFGVWRVIVGCNDHFFTVSVHLPLEITADKASDDRWIRIRAEAIHAFCHPAHLLAGKCLIEVDDMEEIMRLHEYFDVDMNSRLTAAIDAARKEG